MSAESEPADKLIGQVLGSRYEILHRLGEGAMGAVFKARHVKVGRSFAVKVLHARLLRDSKVALRFEREAELAGRLRHANVVGVVDVGEVDGTRYMVMDFAEGPDLAELLAEAPMPAERIIHLVRQLLEGLYHAHEQGLIHRDFKPENVIVERDTHGAEMPRIVDFGIAILRDGGESTDGQGRLTTNGLVLGTPHYMAPEQAVADPIDHRIDLFALGIVIYEMLSGRLPFDGSGAEVARANLLLDPPAISRRVPYLEVDPLLEAFARRLMAKKRDARPATAKAARELLDLIERDRAAAAAALGVPLSARAPAVTQSVPSTRDALDQYFAPESPPTVAMRPTPLPDSPAAQHPDLPAAAYSLPLAPTTEHGRPTSIRTPLSWEASPLARRRTSWFIAGGILGAAGVIAAVMFATSDTNPPPASRDRVVMAPIGPAGSSDTPNAAGTPNSAGPSAAEPNAVAPNADGRAPNADAAAATRRDSAAPGIRPPTSPPASKRPPTTDPQPRTPSPNAVRPPDTRPAPATPSTGAPAVPDPRPAEPRRIDTSPPTTKPAAPTAPPTRPSPKTGVTAGEVANLYSAIPRALSSLPDEEAQDLRDRWRLFNIQRLMLAPQSERDAAAAQLSQILYEANVRKAARAADAKSK